MVVDYEVININFYFLINNYIHIFYTLNCSFLRKTKSYTHFPFITIHLRTTGVY